MRGTETARTTNSVDAASILSSSVFCVYTHALYVIRPSSPLFRSPRLRSRFTLPCTARGPGGEAKTTPCPFFVYLRHTAANRTTPFSLSLLASLLHRVFCTRISCAALSGSPRILSDRDRTDDRHKWTSFKTAKVRRFAFDINFASPTHLHNYYFSQDFIFGRSLLLRSQQLDKLILKQERSMRHGPYIFARCEKKVHSYSVRHKYSRGRAFGRLLPHASLNPSYVRTC